MPEMKKFTKDGEEIPSSDEEKEEALEALKGIFNGSKELVFSEGSLADLERMGLTKDEFLAMLAKDLGMQN